MKISIALCFLVAACAAPATPAASADYFVAPSGDDANDGLSAVTAFATIQHAVDLVRPGGSVFVLPGTYRESVVLDGLGNQSAPITLMGINGLPILSGEGSEIGISCSGCENVIVSCLEFRGFTTAGISVIGSHTVTLRDLVVGPTGEYGVAVSDSNDVVLEWSDVFGASLAGIRFLGVTGGSIRNNRSYNNDGEPYLIVDSVIATEANESF